MRKIEPKNIKIGDFIYIIDNGKKERRYILKKILNRKGVLFEWWMLKEKSKKETHLFEIRYYGGITDMNPDSKENGAFMGYTIHKLNKKEVSEFNKLLILKNL